MYIHNEIGPWPNLDLSYNKETLSTEATTALTSPLQVGLSANNLGSKSEGFMNGYHGYYSLATVKRIAFGICLTPPQNIIEEERPLYLDISGVVNANESSTSLRPNFFVGYIDTAGVAIGSNWNANNLVTDWIPLPFGTGTENFVCNQQILLRDIVSGGGDIDKFLCFGFVFTNSSGSAVFWNSMDYMLSARYATKSINTTGRGV